LLGTSGDDRLRGGEEAELILGGLGDDYAVGGGGNDRLEGGMGNDVLKGDVGDDILYGGEGNDRLFGDEGNDKLYGGDGDDALFGRDGDDWIEGGRGADKLKGGAGADTFVFDTADIDALDIIFDFNSLEGDTILITGLAASSSSSFALVNNGRYTSLEMAGPDGVVEVVRIMGGDLGALELQMTDLGLLFG